MVYFGFGFYGMLGHSGRENELVPRLIERVILFGNHLK